MATIEQGDQKYTVSNDAIEFLKLNEVNLKKIMGSGFSGKITSHDLQQHDKQKFVLDRNRVILQDIKLKIAKFRTTHNIEELSNEEGKSKQEVVPQKEDKMVVRKEQGELLSESKDGSNPKISIPHYTLTKIINVTSASNFVKETSEKYPDTKINLKDLVLKAVHLACLDNPIFYQYFIDQRLYKADTLIINYINHYDITANLTIKLEGPKNLKSYKSSNFKLDDPVSVLRVEDCGLYPVSEIKPIISHNNVS